MKKKPIDLYIQAMFLHLAPVLRMRSEENYGKNCWCSGCSCIAGGRVTRCTNQCTRYSLLSSVSRLDHIYCAFCRERPGLVTRTLDLVMLVHINVWSFEAIHKVTALSHLLLEEQSIWGRVYRTPAGTTMDFQPRRTLKDMVMGNTPQRLRNTTT